jgi:cell division protein FtsB
MEDYTDLIEEPIKHYHKGDVRPAWQAANVIEVLVEDNKELQARIDTLEAEAKEMRDSLGWDK